MSSLKPIGSEKLKGQEKINRILEISKFNENIPNSINEQSRSEYSINMSDGNNYQIVKEKQGYIIKRTISESVSEYIEPMKNRKYYSSYSQAFKRLNLLATELNRLNENKEGVSLFGEQKKFTLKTPKPKMDAAPQVPDSPPPLPEPELPPNPVANNAGVAGDLPIPDDLNLGMDDSEGMDDLEGMGDMGDMGGDEDLSLDTGKEDEGKVTFKSIQKLTGKLTQKVRTLTQEDGMTSEDIKYVINMVISSFDLNSLSDEDKEDIMSKLEGGDEGEDESMGSLDFEGGDEGGDNLDFEGGDAEMGEPEVEEDYGVGAILDSIFSESKVDKVISNYFEFSKKELKEENNKKIVKDIANFTNKISEIKRLSETRAQKERAENFVMRNPEFKLIGLTNKKNLVFEHKNSQRKITPTGRIII
jgi:hypothetical protein